MEVHEGRLHSGIFEYGLCGFVGNDSENLDNHLSKCELYKCDKCDLTFKTLQTLKPHLDDKHPKHMKHTDIMHIQMDKKTLTLSQATKEQLFTCSNFQHLRIKIIIIN